MICFDTIFSRQITICQLGIATSDFRQIRTLFSAQQQPGVDFPGDKGSEENRCD